MPGAGVLGLSPGDASTVDEDRLRLRGLIRTSSGLLINVVEKAAASEDQALVRSIVDAAFFIFSGVESELPGGREFWERMRSNAPGHAGPATVEETRMRQLRALEAFKKELEVYASTRPEIKRLLDGSSAPPGKRQAIPTMAMGWACGRSAASIRARAVRSAANARFNWSS